MNYIERMNIRWTKEELFKNSSIFRIVYLLFPLFIYYISGDAVEMGLWVIINGIAEANPGWIGIEMMNKASYAVKAVIYGIGLLFSMVILYRMAKNEITYVTKGENKPKLNVKQISFIIFISLIFSLGLNYIIAHTGLAQISQTYEEVSNEQYGSGLVTGVIVFGLLSPIAEEVIFRGIIYNRLKRIFPFYISIFLSALLFGIFHGNIVQGIYAFLMGLLMTVFYEKYKSFYAPVIIHMVANIGVYVLSYI